MILDGLLLIEQRLNWQLCVPGAYVSSLWAPGPPEVGQLVWVGGIWGRFTQESDREFRNKSHCKMEQSKSIAERTDWPSGGGLTGDGARRGGSRFTSTSGDFRSGKTLQETVTIIRLRRVIWFASLPLWGIYKTSVAVQISHVLSV